MTGQSPGLLASLRQLAAKLLGIGRTRLELLGIELAEEKARLLGLLLLAVAGMLFLLLALLLGSFLLIVLFWDSARYLAMAVLVGVYLVLGLALLAMVRARIANHPPPFEQTLAELERDRAVLMAEASRLQEARDA
jgi:uncharacterized membrane protein YqjE